MDANLKTNYKAALEAYNSHTDESKDTYIYQLGFGNEFQSEVWQGALPKDQNSPQVCPYGLYAEQISGSAFTMPRQHNLRTWMYRVRPSVCHQPFKPFDSPTNLVMDFAAASECELTPNPLRWSPFQMPPKDIQVPFHLSWHTVCGSGSPQSKSGVAIHVYLANTSMVNACMVNADGEILIVPQHGCLDITTELGKLFVSPNEIVVIPRGIKFAVNLDGEARGYILELYTMNGFELPDLGVIGSNGLANKRDFKYPSAFYLTDQQQCLYTCYNKFANKLWTSQLDHCPFNVVAWHGNYAPYKYDLARFCALNSVTFDHIDPSIFTVLTCKSSVPGLAVADFVIFPPRFACALGTFRPPYFHRNVMTEFMGLIKGKYEAKSEGFNAGGASLHATMTAHGPDTTTFKQASLAQLDSVRVGDETMAFMFETSVCLSVSKWALESTDLQPQYFTHWQGLKSHFNKDNPDGDKHKLLF